MVLTTVTGKRENENKFLFNLFCLWTFVLLCRPQDIFPALSPMRPALATGALTLGVFAMTFKELKAPKFFQERQVKYYALMLFIMVLGVPSSLYARLSFMIIFTEYINVIFFFFIFYKVVLSVNKLSKILLIGCMGSGLYSAFSLITGSLGSGRLYFGRMFDPNDLAYFALAFLPINLIFTSSGNPLWMRMSCFFFFGIEILLILLTGSRGGMLAFGVSAALLLFLKTKTIRSALKVVIVAMCLAFFSFGPINTERYMTLLSLNDDYNIQDETGRLAIWKIGVRAMLANPFTGVGVGCFNNAAGLDREARGAETLKWQTAHNSAIQIGTETGVIGLTFYLLLSINVFRILHGAKKVEEIKLAKIGEMGFVGFAGLFISSMFISQAYSIYWAFYVVFSATVNQLILQEKAFATEKA